jgi:hypothetical protein
VSKREELERLRAKYTPSKRSELERLRAKYKKPEESEKVKAGLMGALQGATMGFSDELWAGTQAGLKELWEAAGGPPSDFGEAYSKAVEENRDEIQRLASKERGAYIAGELASILIPGMGIAKGLKGISTAKKIALGGAAEGAGRGEGLEGKVAMATLGAAAPVIGKGIKKVTKHAGPIAATAIGGATEGLSGAIAGGAGSLLLRKALSQLGKKAAKKKPKTIKEKALSTKETIQIPKPMKKDIKTKDDLMSFEDIQKLPTFAQKQKEYAKHRIARERKRAEKERNRRLEEKAPKKKASQTKEKITTKPLDDIMSLEDIQKFYPLLQKRRNK